MAALPEDLPSKLDRSHELVYVQLAFLLAAGLSVLIRLYVKTFLVKHHSLDDYLIYGALVGYTVYGALAMDSAINGATGKHYALRYSMDEAARSLRGWYLCMALYAPITLTIRASVCVLLLRLARSRVHRWIIWGNFIVIAIISTAFFFVLVFQCSPPSHFWTQVYGSDGRCYKSLIVSYTTTVHSSVCAVSDWCLGLLPIALLWHVKINGRTKAIVAILLSLGMM
jgi:rhodopsin domain-containing protein